MKTTILLISIILMMVTLPAVTDAQTRLSPTGQQMFYTHPLTASNTFAASDKDTFPSPSATPSALRVGGAGYASLTVLVNDTAAIDIFVDARVYGTTAWTNILTDSLIFANTGTYRQEYVLRSQETELLKGLDKEIRVRNAFRASGQGVTSPTYSQTLNWKP